VPLALALAVAASAGCAGTMSAGIYGPDLVYVSPGVQVIADYNEPIFYSDGFYWRYYGGVWYRSSYYSGGWVYARPPMAILRIDRPYAYRHYRPRGWTPRGRHAAPMRGAPAVRGAPPVRAAPPSRGAPPGLRAAPPSRGGPPGRGPGGPPPRGGGRGHHR
jgi:hypothetical protein